MIHLDNQRRADITEVDAVVAGWASQLVAGPN